MKGRLHSDFLHQIVKKLQREQIPIFGNNRSKALNATPRSWKLNRQVVFLYLPGQTSPKRLLLSVRSIRTLKRILEKRPNLGRLGSRPRSQRDA